VSAVYSMCVGVVDACLRHGTVSLVLWGTVYHPQGNCLHISELMYRHSSVSSVSLERVRLNECVCVVRQHS